MRIYMSPAMRDRLRLLLIPTGALLAVLPLIAQGSSCGHDFEFHLINWQEVASQWKQGVLLPHWDFTAAWNAGEPRFVFYPPLSWTIGALLGLFLPWTVVPGTFIWLALTACGFTMYRLAREWTDEGSALAAAGLYMVHPYLLFTFFERSAFAELLAAAWIPLVVLSVLRRQVAIRKVALAVALLWLTNDPAAVMGCYSLALLAFAQAIRMCVLGKKPREAVRYAARIAAGTALGLALAGFYLVPATFEQRWVHIVLELILGTRYQSNFLFGHPPNVSHRAILRTASLCSVTLLILIAVFAAVAFSVRRKEAARRDSADRNFVIAALVLLSSFAGFLLTASSAFFWRCIPELKYLQFPWRFDMILGVAAAALFALALHRMKPGVAAGATLALAIPLLLGAAGDHFFRQFCSEAYGVRGLVASFRNGELHEPRDEYTPATSDPPALGHDDPPTWIASTPDAPAPQSGSGQELVNLRDRLNFTVSSPVPAFLIIHLREYPAWRITVNGKASPGRPHRRDGLIVLPLSSGRSIIAISWDLTTDQIWGWVTTALALGALFILWQRDRTLSSSGLEG